MQKRVVITGGSGLIGSKLTSVLSQKGYQPVILSRKPEPASQKVPYAFDYVEWNAKDQGKWANYINGAYAVVNMAGAPLMKKWDDDYKKIIRDSRVNSTRAIAEAINTAKEPPQALISASAVGIYGDRGDEIITEESLHGDDFLAKVCTDWEREAHGAGSRTRVVNARFGIVQDSRGGSLALMLPFFKLYVGGGLAPGTQWYPWIHIDDIVHMIIWSIENPVVNGPVNFTSPEPLRMDDFAKTLGKVMNRPSIFKVPAFGMRLALGEAADFVTASLKVMPARAKKWEYKFVFPKLDNALRNLLA